MSNEINLIDYLNSSGLQYKPRSSAKGTQVALERCPYCESDKPKGDFSHFYFHQENQTFYCQKCGEKGNLYRFMLDRGDVQPITKAKKIEYKRPKENPSLTSDTEKFYAWYEKERGIKAEILKKYQVGYRKSDDQVTLIYQAYDEKGVLINRKYRTLDKKMWTEKDAEPIFYGLQHVDFNTKYLIVCEGEDDCHAMIQSGFKNVVSMPYGAQNYSPAMDRIVQQMSEIFLCFDNDPTGQAGARKFAEKAGLAKCKNIILPFKDARDCIMNGIDIEKITLEIVKAQQFRHEEIVKAEDLHDQFFRFISDQEKFLGCSISMPEFNRVVGGIRTAELTILTGHTGHGKSTLAYNLIKWVEAAGMRTMIMSFEGRIESVLLKLIEIYTDERLRVFSQLLGKMVLTRNQQWMEAEYEKLNERNIYFLNKIKHKDGYYDLARMGEVIEYAVKFFDVRFFVIDHLHYFLRVSQERNPVQVIDESIRQIKQWTEKHDIHILLLVHPHMTEDTRTGKLAKLGLNCVKGASSIAQESDNFWIVERLERFDQKLAHVRVLKNRGIGKLGTFNFLVSKNKGTYLEYIEPKTEEKKEPNFWND